MKKALAFIICTALFVSALISMPAAALADEPSPYALLSGIDATAGSWNIEYSGNVTSYILTLGETEGAVTITPQKGDASQILTINGIRADSIPVSLDNGKYKNITIAVSQAGKKSRTYYVKVIRDKSSNNDLAALSATAGAMDSEFDPAQLAYYLTIDRYTPTVTIKAAKAEPHATLRIDGYLCTSRKYKLAPGKEKVIMITVRSQTYKTKTYFVRITRESYPSTDKAEALIDFAKHFMGTPYVRGGKTPAGFDCSGFVYYCLNGIGFTTGYRTSAVWPKSGFKTIPTLEQMIPGDILCFKGHVAIYMGGNMMIDSATSVNGVSIKSCVSRYWTENFICGKRVLKQKKVELPDYKKTTGAVKALKIWDPEKA